MITETANYGLNQWQSSDKPVMADFNADNAKIDAALKSFADKNETIDATLTTLSEN